MGKIMYNGRQYSGSFDKSANIFYDNSKSGLNSSNVQAAIDKLASGEGAKATYDSDSHEINRSYLSLRGKTEIPEGVDLNSITYLKVGTYYVPNNGRAQGLANCPTSNAFIMHVYSPLSTSIDDETVYGYKYRVRKIIDIYGAEYVQAANSSATVGTFYYGDWKRILDSNDSVGGGGNYLPLTGGTITGNSDTPLYIQSNTASSYIGFKNNSGTNIGYLGVGSDNKPYFYDTAYKTLLHSGNYSEYCLPVNGTAKTATTLSMFELPSNSNNAAVIFNPYTFTVTSAWAGVSGVYAIHDVESSFSGIFSIKFRVGGSATTLSTGEVRWLVASSTTMPTLTLTHSIDTTNAKTTFRFYISPNNTYKSYRISKISEYVGNTTIATSTSTVSSMTGTTYSTANSIATASSLKGKLSIDVDYGASGGASSLVYDGSENLSLSISAAAVNHNHAASNITSGTLGVARGGTGAATFTSGAALIGNGTGAVTTRAITNMTSKNYITYNTNLMTTNTLAYWNGSYQSNGESNLTYCNQGAFGSIVTKGSGDYVPLTGGLAVIGSSSSTSRQAVSLWNSNRQSALYLSADGGFGLFNNDNDTWHLCINKGSTEMLAPQVPAFRVGNETATASIYSYVQNVKGKMGICVGSSGNMGVVDNGTWIIYQNAAKNTLISPLTTFQIGANAAGSIRPHTTNKMSCGTSSYLWTQVYAKTTSISASDRNQKKDFRTFDSNENYEKFFMDLKPVVYKFKDGESGRDHFGYISQDVEESLYKFGFNDKSFAGFCKDIRKVNIGEEGEEKLEPVLDEDGNVQYDYALRYSEFVSLNTYMIQKLVKENQELREECIELRTKNEELETRLQAIENIIAELKDN